MTYDLEERLEPTVSEADHFETGHEGLMRAVLVDALKVYERGFATTNVVRRKQAREVATWVAAGDDTEWPFSFVNVCECLGIDPECLREQLRRLRKVHGESSYAAKADKPSVRRAADVERALFGGTKAA